MIARVLFNGDRTSVLRLVMDGGDSYTMMRMYLTPLNYTFKMVKMVNSAFCIFYHVFFFLRSISETQQVHPSVGRTGQGQELVSPGLTSEHTVSFMKPRHMGGSGFPVLKSILSFGRGGRLP